MKEQDEFLPGVLDGRSLPLESWLNLVLTTPAKVFPNQAFPTNAHRDEFLESIERRDERQVVALIRRFLPPSGTYGTDELALKVRVAGVRGRASEYDRRLIGAALRGGHVWEGLTWVLDLLPHYPAEAVATVSNYLVANWQYLPDWVVSGLDDALTLLRARYLEVEPTRETLLALTPRDFEFLVAALYRQEDFDTIVTKATRDGGRT